jgi:hypothetical protein
VQRSGGHLEKYGVPQKNVNLVLFKVILEPLTLYKSVSWKRTGEKYRTDPT